MVTLSPCIKKFYDSQLNAFPRHKAFLDKMLSAYTDGELAKLDELARTLMMIVGPDIDAYCQCYRWFAREILKETMYFQENGEYRYSSATEVFKDIYSDSAYMSKYNKGLLLSNLWWKNHFDCLSFYREEFVPVISSSHRHLEIGPGHGIYLLYALKAHSSLKAEAWDLSSESLKKTAQCLLLSGFQDSVRLGIKDLFLAEQSGIYGSIVISEVLEHIDRPADALSIIHRLLKPRGRLFVNMPINSPAIDHVFNLPHPDDVPKLIEDKGFYVEKKQYIPQSNSSLDAAIRNKLNINVVLSAVRAD